MFFTLDFQSLSWCCHNFWWFQNTRRQFFQNTDVNLPCTTSLQSRHPIAHFLVNISTEDVTGSSNDICPKLNIFFSIDTILKVFPISESNNSIFFCPCHKPSGYDRISLTCYMKKSCFLSSECIQLCAIFISCCYFNVRYHYFLYKLLYSMNAVIFNYLFLTVLLEFGRCLIHSKHLIHVCWMNNEWLNFFLSHLENFSFIIFVNNGAFGSFRKVYNSHIVEILPLW